MSRARDATVEIMLLACIVLSACRRPGGEVMHRSLSDIGPVRAAFNADSGKVRAIFLASPT